jgi:hypothetical protein
LQVGYRWLVEQLNRSPPQLRFVTVDSNALELFDFTPALLVTRHARASLFMPFTLSNPIRCVSAVHKGQAFASIVRGAWPSELTLQADSIPV